MSKFTASRHRRNQTPIEKTPSSSKTGSSKPRRGRPSTAELSSVLDRVAVVARGIDDNKNAVFKIQIASSPDPVFLAQSQLDTDSWWTALNHHGAGLHRASARNAVMGKIEAAYSLPETFKAVTRIGFDGATFVLPDVSYPSDPDRIIAVSGNLGDVPAAKFRCQSNPSAKKLIDRLCRGNSRLMLCRAHGLSAPVAFLINELSLAIISLPGPGGIGKTVTGNVSSCDAGRHLDEIIAGKLGFGETFNETTNHIETLFPAHSGQALFIDETRAEDTAGKSVGKAVIDLAFRSSSGRIKARLGQTTSQSFLVPILVTSNMNVFEIGRENGVPVDAAIYERVIDIPVPKGASMMFETLHGHAGVDDFAAELMAATRRHFGVALRTFAERLCDELQTDRKRVIRYIKRRMAYFLNEIAPQMARLQPGRNLTRLNRRFALLYATGCLASRYKVWPYSNGEWRHAIRSCQKDHLRLVAVELKAPNPAQVPVERLKSYFNAHRDRFPSAKVEFVDINDVDGFRGTAGTRNELWITFDRLSVIMGGKGNVRALVKRLAEMQKLDTSNSDGRTRYVVKRMVQGNRLYVVAIDASVLKL